MRLICPNCSAQYEIDVSLIPDEGRDVQCSNCGHTWFELPPAPPVYADAPVPEAPVAEDDIDVSAAYAEREYEPETREEPESEPETPEEPSAEAETETRSVSEPEPGPEQDSSLPGSFQEDEPETPETEREDAGEPSTAARAIAAAAEEADDDSSEADPFAAAAAAGAALNRRKPVDDDALSILREEAEREMSQRRAPPTTPLETQTDMPLDEVRGRNTPSRALRARMARSDDEEAAAKGKKEKKQDPRVRTADEGYEAPRRDLLPDIDEINSSLKSRKGRTEAEPETAAEKRKGFRIGFLLMILIAVLMIFAYAWAPAIAGMAPALENPLLVYVDWANGVRDWIDGLLGGA